MKPRIAITIGDPAGIGPELAIQAATDPIVIDQCIPVLFGDLSAITLVAERLHLPLPKVTLAANDNVDWQSITEPAILNFGNSLTSLTPGKVSLETGRASYGYVTAAIDAAIATDVAAVVTGPIQKEAWASAGIKYPGHTELLADRTGADRYCMMLTSETISCALVTVHVGLSSVSSLLTIENILETIELGHESISQKLERSALIAVCGLNPHAGEGGMFGEQEEERFIQPAIKLAQRRGLNVVGPVPADTAFVPAMREKIDLYVCMYHDQGLIPLKTLCFDDAVNVTLGLPIVRTSVDHGTALDIAWQGKASVSSLKEAISMAVRLS